MRKSIYFGLLFGIIFNGLLFAASVPDPNKAVPTAAQPQSQNAVSVSTQQQSVDYQQKLIEEKLSSFDKKTDFLKWAVTSVLTCMGFIITVVLAAVGFISWKSQKEYRDSLSDVKDALKEAKEFAKKAEESCSHAEEWEKRSKQAFESIDEQAKLKIGEFDKKADDKFKEIDIQIKELGNKVEKRVIRESKKQREISKKWNDALKATQDNKYEIANQLWAEITKENPHDYLACFNWGTTLLGWARLGGIEAENRYQAASNKYQKAAELMPDDHEIYDSWGTVLSDWADMGGLEAENRYQEACTKFKMSTEIKPDYYEAFDNWGATLSSLAKNGGVEAEKRYQEACIKHQKASEIKPDDSKVYNNWGNTYLLWSSLKTAVEEKETLYQKAEKKLLKAEEIKKGTGAYNLACVFALRKNEKKCQEWLKIGEEAKTLPEREHAMKDEDMASVRDKDWFQVIRWKGEQ